MSKIYTWDAAKNIVIPGNKEETVLFCVKHFLYCAEQAMASHGYFAVALSGGSTPKALYDLLGHHHSSALDWSKVYLFWSDERSVAPDHPDSNYHMAMQSGLKLLPILPSHIFRMPADGVIKEGAKSYEATLDKILQGSPLDLIMLGMGDDGHTASLFPNTEGIKDDKHKVVANYIPEKSTWRMTFTASYINTATHIVFYVLGAAKKEALNKVFISPSGTYPCTLIGTKAHPALWILDKEAASSLNLAS
ncbi:MAG: 6-phosphogluconolactonase [Chlamydiae bacterium]|nr:6-phosphogluconolactonase [Chlamydiota bacterium]